MKGFLYITVPGDTALKISGMFYKRSGESKVKLALNILECNEFDMMFRYKKVISSLPIYRPIWIPLSFNKVANRHNAIRAKQFASQNFSPDDIKAISRMNEHDIIYLSHLQEHEALKINSKTLSTLEKIRNLERLRDIRYMTYQYYLHGEDENIRKAFLAAIKRKYDEKQKEFSEYAWEYLQKISTANAYAGYGHSLILKGNNIFKNIKDEAITMENSAGTKFKMTSEGVRTGLSHETLSKLEIAGKGIAAAGAFLDTAIAIKSAHDGDWNEFSISTTSATLGTIGIFIPEIGVVIFWGSMGVAAVNTISYLYNRHIISKTDNKIAEEYKHLYLKLDKHINKLKESL